MQVVEREKDLAAKNAQLQLENLDLMSLNKQLMTDA